MSVPKVGDLVWHLHHDVLVEPLIQPFETRVAYIKAEKPAHEVETRLRRMKPVRGDLSFLDKAYAELHKACAEWYKARAEWYKARAEWAKACAEWAKACAEWDKASADHRVLTLHAKECPNCPWNGETIFP